MTPSTTVVSFSPPLIELCIDHDLTLNIKNDDGPIICRYRVYKRILCIASPIWRAMLIGKFMEADCQNPEMPLVDDDPEALLTVLRIAHHRTYEAPRALSLPQLVKIATVCDKCDTVAICRLHIDNWMTPLLLRLTYLTPGNETWLWCAWVFGYHETFSEIVNKL